MTHEKPELAQSAGEHQESQGVTVDQDFKDLLEASSLGTSAARQIRSMTPAEAVEEVRLRIKRNQSRPAKVEVVTSSRGDDGSLSGTAVSAGTVDITTSLRPLLANCTADDLQPQGEISFLPWTYEKTDWPAFYKSCISIFHDSLGTSGVRHVLLSQESSGRRWDEGGPAQSMRADAGVSPETSSDPGAAADQEVSHVPGLISWRKPGSSPVASVREIAYPAGAPGRLSAELIAGSELTRDFVTTALTRMLEEQIDACLNTSRMIFFYAPGGQGKPSPIAVLLRDPQPRWPSGVPAQACDAVGRPRPMGYRAAPIAFPAWIFEDLPTQDEAWDHTEASQHPPLRFSSRDGLLRRRGVLTWFPGETALGLRADPVMDTITHECFGASPPRDTCFAEYVACSRQPAMVASTQRPDARPDVQPLWDDGRWFRFLLAELEQLGLEGLSLNLRPRVGVAWLNSPWRGWRAPALSRQPGAPCWLDPQSHSPADEPGAPPVIRWSAHAGNDPMGSRTGASALESGQQRLHPVYGYMTRSRVGYSPHSRWLRSGIAVPEKETCVAAFRPVVVVPEPGDAMTGLGEAPPRDVRAEEPHVVILKGGTDCKAGVPVPGNNRGVLKEATETTVRSGRAGNRRLFPLLRPAAVAAMVAAPAIAAAAMTVAVIGFHDPRSAVRIQPRPESTTSAISSLHIRRVTSAVLLFRFKSAVLPPDASSVLRHLAEQALSYHLRVSVTGYAPPNRGTSEYRYTLLERRAAAVRDRLIILGVPARKITAVGRGAESQSMESCEAQGHRHPDESGCELLRRVDVVLVP